MIEHEPRNAERAAVRWLGRWALELQNASLGGLLEATVALSALAHEPQRWEGVLRQLRSRRTAPTRLPDREGRSAERSLLLLAYPGGSEIEGDWTDVRALFAFRRVWAMPPLTLVTRRSTLAVDSQGTLRRGKQEGGSLTRSTVRPWALIPARSARRGRFRLGRDLGSPFFQRQVVGVEAEFTIQAEQGEVTGRKVLLEQLPLVNQPPTFTFGACVDRGGAAGVFGALIPAQLCYNARLPGGERDRGRATLLVGNDSLVTANQFSENFVSDPTANCGFEPETKEACKNEGFKEFDFLGFKNQGDCVSFVETEGKNEPGKNQRKRAISGE